MDLVLLTTAELAVVTTILLLLLATPVAWWLARSRRWWREIVGAVTAVPLVLPPTVIGFYVLVALGPESPLMAPLQRWFGIRTLAFTFEGLVIGSLFYSLPFAVQPLRAAFEQIGDRPLEIAATMGAGPLDRFLTVAAPLARGGFLSAGILVFAHTVGEFGVVLMIGGAVPGKTEVLSTRIYQLVESLQFEEAHRIAAGLVLFAFVTIFALLLVERRIRFLDR